jgi:type IV secretion system protein VirB11
MSTNVSLEHHARSLREMLGVEGATEVCVNRPGEAFVETDRGWQRVEEPELTFAWAEGFAKTLGSANMRGVGDHKTLLSATMHSGERVNVVYPPSCEPGTIAITIRKPSSRRITHAELVKGEIYLQVKRDLMRLDPEEEELLALYRGGKYEEFIPRAVHYRRNIIASGPTGSGKTTYTNSLVDYIP